MFHSNSVSGKCMSYASPVSVAVNAGESFSIFFKSAAFAELARAHGTQWLVVVTLKICISFLPSHLTAKISIT